MLPQTGSRRWALRETGYRLSGLGSTLPIIFLTGHPDIPTTVQAIKAGADDFLTKPVSSNELLQAVERAIAHHEMTRGLKTKLDMVRAHIAALTPIFTILKNARKCLVRAARSEGSRSENASQSSSGRLHKADRFSFFIGVSKTCRRTGQECRKIETSF